MDAPPVKPARRKDRIPLVGRATGGGNPAPAPASVPLLHTVPPSSPTTPPTGVTIPIRLPALPPLAASGPTALPVPAAEPAPTPIQAAAPPSVPVPVETRPIPPMPTAPPTVPAAPDPVPPAAPGPVPQPAPAAEWAAPEWHTVPVPRPGVWPAPAPVAEQAPATLHLAVVTEHPEAEHGPEPVTPAPAPAAPAPPAPAPEPAPAAAPVAAGTVAEPSADAVLIRRTLAEIAPTADRVTSYFYALLFTEHPNLRAMFPAAMDVQRDRLLTALLTAAEHIDNPEVLVPYLRRLGSGHRKYGTRSEHYPAVGEALVGALSRHAAEVWGPETEAAWVRAYTLISQTMIDAAAESERTAPAWWQGEVVSHELRTRDIAVLTVRPDQPYPFLAGQYTSLETPWWPRVWRNYSFASAPRADGLLSFHVKAVPAGWVSTALVRHARPGDVLRLGPPAGSMVVDHSTDNGMLCLGGGTGIAPIKALIEDVAEHGERRPMEVFFGARTDGDLYVKDTLLGLQRSHPWLSVRPVVCEGLVGQLPQAAGEHGPWHAYDAFVSGPPAMIRDEVAALKRIGIPGDRIRFDEFDEVLGRAG
ncbi:globin domain-containing protein [Streptomyces sp. BI20]|uniref:globin domain-containing protein n=1 Tax=Streptomyces sp. BI20 TaxID=3403460 RepID=UPI003C76E028